MARPLRALLAHEGVERAARHDAQPAAIGKQLLLIDAEVKRGDFLRVQVFELEGAARGEGPRWRAFGPGFGGLLQVRQDGRELRLEAFASAHGAEEPLRYRLRERRGRVLGNVGDALHNDFLPADRELAHLRQCALHGVRVMERMQDERGQQIDALG